MMMMKVPTTNVAVTLFATIISSLLISEVDAGCYFPLELQGEFLTQSMTSREIAYTSISVLFDSIPSWGSCHKRIGHHVILLSDQEDRGQDQPCYKCINMVSRSPNVIQVHHHGRMDQCFPTESQAQAACPTQEDIRTRVAREKMLYKTRSFYGGSAITKTYCPLNGRYKFTYSINDGTEDDLECREPLSEAGDCPTGYKFDLIFRGCSFPNFNMSFQCLGSWPGENGETYMSLLDTKLPQIGEEARPRYRCALFKEDPYTGLTHVALSSDSTCVNHLYSAQDGFETLHLEKEVDNDDRDDDQSDDDHNLECIFPDWMQGQWEGVTVKGGQMVYRDEQNFLTYRGKCVMRSTSPDRFVVNLKTDCGQRLNYCALFQQRDVNVMEFQLGVSSSVSPDSSLCDASHFSPSRWLTLGRAAIDDPPPCPLIGEYEGVIPDADGLCAKSYTDCNNAEVMFYTVYNCQNASEVYEEREYRCFGQWEEAETGLVYTYTERRDLPGRECFVGVSIDDNTHLVTEAGANCERGHEPRQYGMTLHRTASCSASSAVKKDQNIDTVIRPTFQSIDEAVEAAEDDLMRDLLSSSTSTSTTEVPRAVSPKLRGPVNTSRAKVNKNKNNSHRRFHIYTGDSTASEDIFTNEIPGSSSSSSSASVSSSRRASLSSSVFLLITWTSLIVLLLPTSIT